MQRRMGTLAGLRAYRPKGRAGSHPCQTGSDYQAEPICETYKGRAAGICHAVLGCFVAALLAITKHAHPGHVRTTENRAAACRLDSGRSTPQLLTEQT